MHNDKHSVEIIGKQANTNVGLKFIRLKDVIEMTSLSRSSIYAMSKKGTFPASIRITDGRVVWLESDIVKWMKQHITDSHKT